MPVIADVAQEKQRLSEQLAKIDAERSKLQDELNELEVTERVLSRFGKQRGAQPRRALRAEARPKEAVAQKEKEQASPQRMRATRRKVQSLSLGDATLSAVKAHSGGVSADQVRDYLAKQFGMTVRPNHLGMALQRHRRAGRLEMRDFRWYAPQ